MDFFQHQETARRSTGYLVTLFLLMRFTAPVDWNRAMGPADEAIAEPAS